MDDGEMTWTDDPTEEDAPLHIEEPHDEGARAVSELDLEPSSEVELADGALRD